MDKDNQANKDHHADQLNSNNTDLNQKYFMQLNDVKSNDISLQLLNKIQKLKL